MHTVGSGVSFQASIPMYRSGLPVPAAGSLKSDATIKQGVFDWNDVTVFFTMCSEALSAKTAASEVPLNRSFAAICNLNECMKLS